MLTQQKLIESDIKNSLRGIANKFGKNELAFLALTTKIELPFRDRWAYALYQKLNKVGLIVSREWRRVDMAILEKNKQVALIELKAMYTFDALDEAGFYKEAIEQLKMDAVKAGKTARKHKQITKNT